MHMRHSLTWIGRAGLLPSGDVTGLPWTDLRHGLQWVYGPFYYGAEMQAALESGRLSLGVFRGKSADEREQ